MPLVKKEDFANGDESSQFCLYCVKEDGTAKSCEEIFRGGVDFFMQMLGSDKALAERITRRNMASLPYWQNQECDALKGDMATDEEFDAAMKKLAE